MTEERKAEFMDTFGSASKYLFARHKDTGHRITTRMFYRKPGDNTFERDGYVLMTTRKREQYETEAINGQSKLFDN